MSGRTVQGLPCSWWHSQQLSLSTLPTPQVCPETNQVLINIGLLLLAFPSPTEEGQLR